MARVQKFYKSPAPTQNGLGTPIGTIHWSDSEVNGDRKRPNAYRMRRTVYQYAFADTQHFSRNRMEDPFDPPTSGPSGGDFKSYSEVNQFDDGVAEYGPAFREAYDAALGVLLGRLKSKEWNTVVFGAEFGKSFGMIVNSATKMYAMFDALRKGNLGNAYKALGITPSNSYGTAGKRRYPKARSVRQNLQAHWLELQMGWKPLLADMDNAAKAIADYVVRRPPDLCKVSGRGGREHSTAKTLSATTQWGVGQSVTTDTNECQIILYYTFNDRTVATAKKFGLTTVLPTIWELVPYSWVVDYVIGIGDFLENLMAYQGLDFHSGCVTHLYKSEAVWGQPGIGTFFKAYNYLGNYTYLQRYSACVGAWRYSRRHFSMNREVLTSFPYQTAPKVTFDFSGERGVIKTLNLLALFGQFKK